MTDYDTVLCEALGVSLTRLRRVKHSKISNINYYAYYYSLKVEDTIIDESADKDMAYLKYDHEVSKRDAARYNNKALNDVIAKARYNVDCNNRLIDLINFRLDTIYEVTIADYVIVKNLIHTAKLYNLGDKYIHSIKVRFNEFRL